jgi:hypothetical protein
MYKSTVCAKDLTVLCVSILITKKIARFSICTTSFGEWVVDLGSTLFIGAQNMKGEHPNKPGFTSRSSKHTRSAKIQYISAYTKTRYDGYSTWLGW